MDANEKLKLNDRIEVAKTILMNIKDDMKLQAERKPKQKTLYTFLASEACKNALALNELQMKFLQAEKALAEYVKGEK